MNVSTPNNNLNQGNSEKQKYPPETDIYVGLLVLLYLHDQKDIRHVG